MTFDAPDLSAGDGRASMIWEVENLLARSHRPGYPSSRPEPHQVRQWVEQALELGIKSVIALLDHEELQPYSALPLEGGGLLAYYRRAGLQVAHIPVRDYKVPPLSGQELASVWEAFQGLEKPVVVHCAAGRDRTGAAVRYLVAAIQQHRS